MAYIVFKEVSKSFNGMEVISNLSLEVKKKGVMGILGPSGSGKTTLLRLLSGLETPDCGVISIGGEPVFDSKKRVDVAPEKRDVGMVFQDLALWPHLTVREHIDFVLKARHLPGDERRAVIRDCLKLVHLEGRDNSRPGELSGGERQRVALIRALAQEPRVLLMDEPFSNLDQILKKDFRKEIKSLQKRFDVTILYVTHNYLDIADVADYLAVMQDGRVIQQGPMEEVYQKPVNDFAAGILGK